MSERGGSTTQSGILYQNSIATLYLGRLCDVRPRAKRERVIEVRIEAPSEVDDIVITFEDRHKCWIQAKENVRTSTPEWKKLWRDFAKQRWSPHFGPEDELKFVTGSSAQNFRVLEEATERAKGYVNYDDWQASLAKPMKSIIRAIVSHLPQEHQNENLVFELFSKLSIEIFTLKQIERDEVARWMPESNVDVTTLFSLLRDKTGGHARYRKIFFAVQLLEDLGSSHSVSVREPSHYGVATYMETIKKSTDRMVVPGTQIGGSIESLFLWPTLQETRGSPDLTNEFEEENPHALREKPRGTLNLKSFPNPVLQQAIIVAGAGYGKTALLTAVANQLTHTPRLPVLLSLPELAESKTTVIGYLHEHHNKRFTVDIPWDYYCSLGRTVILFDGLDELSGGDRREIGSKIKDFSDRFPNVSWLLTVRDTGALPSIIDAKILRLDSISDEQIPEFAEAYRSAGSSITKEVLLATLKTNPDLKSLTRIPLFLSLLLATSQSSERLPTKRSELVERYLHILLHPNDYKPSIGLQTSPHMLREVAELLAFSALERGKIGFTLREVRQHMSSGLINETILNDLVACGLLKQSPLRLGFVYPIIQEYLAADHILRTENDKDIAERFKLAVRRPWAQTLQFVIERHDSPDTLIQDLLEEADDAFGTTIRILGRCVANGTNVSLKTKTKIGNRLAAVWLTLPWASKDLIGNILLDGFTNPLPESVVVILRQARGLNSGGKQLVANVNDSELTKDVIRAILNEKVEDHYFLHEMQITVDNIADQALEMYIAYAKENTLSYKTASNLAHLIHALNPQKLKKDSYKNIIEDPMLPDPIRLAGYMLSPPEELEQGLHIADAILRSEQTVGKYLAHCAIEKSEKADSWRLRYIYDKTLPMNERQYHLLDFVDEDSQKVKSPEALKSIALDKELEEELRLSSQLLLGSNGMLEIIPKNLSFILSASEMNLNLLCVVLNRLRNNEPLVINSIESFRDLPLSLSTRVSLAFSLSLAMIWDVKLHAYGGWSTNGLIAHPSLENVSNLIWSWVENYVERDKNYLQLLTGAAQLNHPQAAQAIENEILRLASSSPDVFSHDSSSGYAQTISSALSTLKDYKGSTLSLNALKGIAEISSHNPASNACNLIEKKNNDAALDTLLELVNNPKMSFVNGNLTSSIERLASRLGIRLIKRSDKMQREVELPL